MTYCNGQAQTTVSIFDVMSRLPEDAKLSTESIREIADFEALRPMTLKEMDEIEDICTKDSEIDTYIEWSCTHGEIPGDYNSPPQEPDFRIECVEFEASFINVSAADLRNVFSINDTVRGTHDIWTIVYDDFLGECW